jgi:sigma-B regulation protein RsbU (phosphoserine phosphatase)
LVALTRTGMALGLFDFVDFWGDAVQLDHGDFIVLYTDGVTEAIDAHLREFGEDRLRRVLLDNAGASAEDMAAVLEESITAFTGAAAPSDDITYVIAKRV